MRLLTQSFGHARRFLPLLLVTALPVLFTTELWSEGAVALDGQIYFNSVSSLAQGTYNYSKTGAIFYALTPTQAFAALLIHELAHVTKDFPPDGDDSNESLLNSSRARYDCFGYPDK